MAEAGKWLPAGKRRTPALAQVQDYLAYQSHILISSSKMNVQFSRAESCRFHAPQNALPPFHLMRVGRPHLDLGRAATGQGDDTAITLGGVRIHLINDSATDFSALTGNALRATRCPEDGD